MCADILCNPTTSWGNLAAFYPIKNQHFVETSPAWAKYCQPGVNKRTCVRHVDPSCVQIPSIRQVAIPHATVQQMPVSKQTRMLSIKGSVIANGVGVPEYTHNPNVT